MTAANRGNAADRANSYRIELSEGGKVVARSVIAASGARYRRLEVPQLERFEGVSVHYAATEVEAQRYEDEEVVVVGGGNSAGQAALFLATRTRRVYLLIRSENLVKSMSSYLVERIMATGNVELLTNTEIRSRRAHPRPDSRGLPLAPPDNTLFTTKIGIGSG